MIAKNYYWDCVHVVICMHTQNCHTSISYVKKHVKRVSNSCDCGEIEELEVIPLEGSRLVYGKYLVPLLQMENTQTQIKRRESKFCVRFWVAKKRSSIVEIHPT